MGIRNELWIIPTVGCVNGIGDLIKNRFLEEVRELGIDGCYVFPHNYGCSQLGDDHENTKAEARRMEKKTEELLNIIKASP